LAVVVVAMVMVMATVLAAAVGLGQNLTFVNTSDQQFLV
jgi:hypothetical protein